MSRPVAEVEPQTSNLYVEPVRYDVIDKIDLLFMIDNSRSMGDKQKLLATAVPQLVDRLVVPRCVKPDSTEVRQRASLDEACPEGFTPEFHAVKDIHVAVITSSLGAHGAPSSENSNCNDSPPGNDRALLLPSVRPDLTSYDASGFLAWDPEQKLMPGGETDKARLGLQFSEMVRAAREDGCGYEASLEAWYRFLIDPEPPLQVSIGADGRSQVSAIDMEVLAQRERFLRPDSLVAIVMLTDENDCSVRDEEYGHFLAAEARMPRGTSACERDPNDKCCLPCILQSAAPEGCPAVAADPACQRDVKLSSSEDPANLRCFQNKRRYGYDFLYPTSRYVQALTQPLVPRRSDGVMVENPLFKPGPGGTPRERDLVYLAGIVGVPWQDIADEASLTGPGLRYRNAAELAADGRWAMLVGDSATNVPPGDPFMRESTAPRSGNNPVTSEPIVAETSLDPRANSINGHEQVDVDGRDLQYACTFPLADPAPCDGPACDCNGPGSADGEDETLRNRPLCQPPGGGPAGTTQYFGKAYPGLRPLEVLRGIGDSAIVASICPKVLTPGEPGYGYEPAVDAIVDRLKVVLGGRCPPRPLAVQPGHDGELPCVVVEALPPTTQCSCSAAGRSPASPEARRMVERQMLERRQCGTASTPSCDSLCFCEIAQASGPNLERCLNDPLGGSDPGYCYLDPFGTPPRGNPALVEDCGSAQRKIRFVGTDTPTPGAPAYIACLGATLH
jgi:hypothetical protein